MLHRTLEPKFVTGVPRTLEPGILYVSMEYGTVVHSCCCGCGHEVVTPLTPTDWHLSYDGEGVSLWPSVGNWNLPCRSHYIIDGNRVRPMGDWSENRIRREQLRDKAAKQHHFASANDGFASGDTASGSATVSASSSWARLKATFRRWRG